MSNQYLFILGNTPVLSSAEVLAVLTRKGLSADWGSISEEVLVLETKEPIDPKALIGTLGGTVKIGQFLPSNTTPEQWLRGRQSNGRLVVGVSVYVAAVGVPMARCAEVVRTVRGDILQAKRALKEEGRSLRLVTGRERVLSSVALVTEHVLERGGELVALVSHGSVQFGETLAVQAFHEYRRRDMRRPSRNARRGMLPPKVAQMMVNLALVPESGVILDPFCGSGTILQEAALLGYRTVGSDRAQEAITDTKNNFQWLASDSRFTFHDSRLFVSDVRDLPKHLPPHSVDAIVTEPYLGPPLTGRERPEQLAKIRRDVAMLVTDAFKSFREVLRPGGRVVIVLPVYQRSDLRREVRPHTLLPFDPIKQSGWRLVSVVPGIAKNLSGITPRGTILYSRADQHLAREIVVLYTEKT